MKGRKQERRILAYRIQDARALVVAENLAMDAAASDLLRSRADLARMCGLAKWGNATNEEVQEARDRLGGAHARFGNADARFADVYPARLAALDKARADFRAMDRPRRRVSA